VQAPWGLVLQSTALAAIAPHFFTDRTAPTIPSANGATDWSAIAMQVGVAPQHLWRFHQVHGNEVERVRGTGALPTPPPRADAGVTRRSDAALGVKVADCVPILMADKAGRGVAAVHAGWRGAAAGIVERAVEALSLETGSSPADIVAAVGPSIGACCYEVGDEVRAAFMAIQPASAQHFTPAAGKWRLDLWDAVRQRLALAGLAPENMHVAALCTATHLDWFPSYRKQGSAAGRMLAVIRRQ
jgi:YfiH family protein